MNACRPDSSSPEKSNHEHATLVVFLRRPVPGVGKRRIAADLGAAVTHTLANHLLAATLEDAGAWPGPVVLAPANAGMKAISMPPERVTIQGVVVGQMRSYR